MSSKDPAPNVSSSTDVPTLGNKLRYYIDLFLSWSPVARFIGLFGLSFFMIALCATLAVWADAPGGDIDGDFLEAMWWSLGRVADAGTMGGDKGTLLRAVAIFATLTGIMVVALLIGLVSSTVADKIDDLRKGKSPVIDSDHTLILGFSEKVFPILRELKEANASRKRSSIVILSPRDKEEVENEVAERMPDMGKTRVVVRQGSSFVPADLRKVGAGRARSIIVLASDVAEDSEASGGASNDSDINAIKTLLALRSISGVFSKNHAVVELNDAQRAPVIERLGRGGVEVVAMRETLARMMVQTSRQAGLASVYRDLLSFDGSEFYLKSFPELAGTRFRDVQAKLLGAIALGVRRTEQDGTVTAQINPNGDMILKAQDELMVLAEDDNTFSLQGAIRPNIQPQAASKFTSTPRGTERILVCGHRSDIGPIVADFDAYAAPGSSLAIMPGSREGVVLPEGPFKNLTVSIIDGDPASPDGAAQIAAGGYTSVLHVADDQLPADQADALTVMALLLLREALSDVPPARRPRIVSEVLDPRTKDLVSIDDSADFVVSSEITSMLLAQVSEERGLNAVYRDLFDPEGSEVYLKSVERYVTPGVPYAWVDVIAIAGQYGEIPLGCFRQGAEPLLNPRQDQPLVFHANDKLIVLAEDESEQMRPVARAA